MRLKPAFPEVRIKNGDNYNPAQKIYYQGMTLRDYFAAKAMQSLLANPNCPLQVEEKEVANQSYTMADAMLKAREE